MEDAPRYITKSKFHFLLTSLIVLTQNTLFNNFSSVLPHLANILSVFTPFKNPRGPSVSYTWDAASRSSLGGLKKSGYDSLVVLDFLHAVVTCT